MSWLQKYDLEMSDKQVELDEFIVKYEDEGQKVEDLEVNWIYTSCCTSKKRFRVEWNN